MQFEIMDIPAAVLLFIFTITDMKTGTISRAAAIVGMVSGLMIRILLPEYRLLDGVGGILGAGLFFLLSWLSKEAIGRGDCYMLCAAGAFYGFTGMLELFFFALVFAACYAVYLLVRRKADRKTGFPFMPFLLLAWIFTKVLTI